MAIIPDAFTRTYEYLQSRGEGFESCEDSSDGDSCGRVWAMSV